jgi:hypothetical protein
MTTAAKKYLRWALVLCPPLLIALVGAVYFGPQIRVYNKMRRITGPPPLWEVPRPLADATVSAAPGTVLAYFGYEFEVPWVGIKKETNEGRWVKVTFQSGQVVSFFNPNYFQDDILLLGAKWQPNVFRQAFGLHPSGSKYEHLKAALSISPSRLSPFRSHRVFAQYRVYLQTKSIWFEHIGLVDIFAVQSTTYKGFETSAISRGGGVEILLFDAADRRFGIDVSRASGSAAILTQPEMNRVIQSFGPATSTTLNHTQN